MIPLEQVKVASPCSASWEAMTGTAQVRHCESCQKNVYNLSEMTKRDAEQLVTRLEGHLCVRYYTRSDGTILTQDCPVGLRAARKRLAARLSYAVALLLSCLTGLARPSRSAPPLPMMGDMVMSAPPPPSTATMGAPPPLPPRHTMGKIALRPHHPPVKLPRVKPGQNGKTRP